MGKLVRWLRMMGYDTRFFTVSSDSRMVATVLAEDRVLLTRDTQIIKRRVVSSGQLRAIFIHSDDPEQQIRQVVGALQLGGHVPSFSRCLECNRPLEARSREQVRELVPPYVFKTQRQYTQCQACHRVYCRGTHWWAMAGKLERLGKS